MTEAYTKALKFRKGRTKIWKERTEVNTLREEVKGKNILFSWESINRHKRPRVLPSIPLSVIGGFMKAVSWQAFKSPLLCARHRDWTHPVIRPVQQGTCRAHSRCSASTMDRLQKSQPCKITRLSETRHNWCLARSKDVLDMIGSASCLQRGPASKRLPAPLPKKELAVVSDEVGLHKSNSVSSHMASALSTKSVPCPPQIRISLCLSLFGSSSHPLGTLRVTSVSDAPAGANSPQRIREGSTATR